MIIKNVVQSKSIKLKIFKDFKELNLYHFQPFKYLFPLKLIQNFTKESTLFEIRSPNQNGQIWLNLPLIKSLCDFQLIDYFILLKHNLGSLRFIQD